MTEYRFQVGDPVWSKMKGYPAWPSRIAGPHEANIKNVEAEKSKAPKNYYLVYFFGSNNFAWMPEDTVKPYADFVDENKKKGKSPQFKKGIKAIEEYLEKGGKATLSQPPIEPPSDVVSSPPAAGDSLSNDANLDGKYLIHSSSRHHSVRTYLSHRLCAWPLSKVCSHINQPTSSHRDAISGKKLPSIDEELDAIRNSKPTTNSTSKKNKKSSQDSQDVSSSTAPTVPASVQKDYSRTPFNSTKRKTNSKNDDSTELTSPTKRVRSDDGDFGVPSLPSPIQTPKSQPPPNKVQARNIITRVQPLERPVIETPQIDSSLLANRYKNVRPSSLKFGFIGLGMMGQRLVKHLLESGHQITLYNRNLDRLDGFKEAGASLAQTPSDVISASDITFTCVSGPAAVKEMLFSKFGILSEMTSKKALVDLGSSDPEGSSDISDAIVSKDGRFLAAPIISCGKTAAQNGELIIVASGDKVVYEDCASCFKAMAKKSVYLGPGYCEAPKMGLVFSAFYGTVVGSLIECLRLVDQLTLKKEEFIDILKSSLMNSPLTELMGRKIVKRQTDLEMPLNYLQRDLRMALSLSDDRPIGCPITAIVNEVYKSRCSFSTDEDVTAVFYG